LHAAHHSDERFLQGRISFHRHCELFSRNPFLFLVIAHSFPCRSQATVSFLFSCHCEAVPLSFTAVAISSLMSFGWSFEEGTLTSLIGKVRLPRFLWSLAVTEGGSLRGFVRSRSNLVFSFCFWGKFKGGQSTSSN